MFSRAFFGFNVAGFQWLVSAVATNEISIEHRFGSGCHFDAGGERH